MIRRATLNAPNFNVDIPPAGRHDVPEPFSSRPIHRSVCLIGAVAHGRRAIITAVGAPGADIPIPQKQTTCMGNRLEGDQLGELGRDVSHRHLSSTQAVSRAEQGADVAKSVIRRAVHDGNELVTR